MLEARAKLRGSLETGDSAAARALWWDCPGRRWSRRSALGAAVNDVAFSPDGRYIAAACQDKSIYIYDVRTHEVRLLRGHANRSSPWPSPPTAATWRRGPGRARSASGTWPAGGCGGCAGTRGASGTWPSAPTASAWPPRLRQDGPALGGRQRTRGPRAARAHLTGPLGRLRPRRRAPGLGLLGCTVRDLGPAQRGAAPAARAGTRIAIFSVAYAPDGKRLASATWIARSASGTPPRARSARCCAGTTPRSTTSPSAPTASAWPRAATTRPCTSGTWREA